MVTIPLCSNCRSAAVCAQATRSHVAELGLTVTLVGTLAKYPGSVHFHIQRPGESGTLEYTIAPRDGKAWLSYHDNRFQPWISVAIESLSGRDCFNRIE